MEKKDKIRQDDFRSKWLPRVDDFIGVQPFTSDVNIKWNECSKGEDDRAFAYLKLAEENWLYNKVGNMSLMHKFKVGDKVRYIDSIDGMIYDVIGLQPTLEMVSTLNGLWCKVKCGDNKEMIQYEKYFELVEAKTATHGIKIGDMVRFVGEPDTEDFVYKVVDISRGLKISYKIENMNGSTYWIGEDKKHLISKSYKHKKDKFKLGEIVKTKDNNYVYEYGGLDYAGRVRLRSHVTSCQVALSDIDNVEKVPRGRKIVYSEKDNFYILSEDDGFGKMDGKMNKNFNIGDKVSVWYTASELEIKEKDKSMCKKFKNGDIVCLKSCDDSRYTFTETYKIIEEAPHLSVVEGDTAYWVKKDGQMGTWFQASQLELVKSHGVPNSEKYKDTYYMEVLAYIKAVGGLSREEKTLCIDELESCDWEKVSCEYWQHRWKSKKKCMGNAFDWKHMPSGYHFWLTISDKIGSVEENSEYNNTGLQNAYYTGAAIHLSNVIDVSSNGLKEEKVEMTIEDFKDGAVLYPDNPFYVNELGMRVRKHIRKEDDMVQDGTWPTREDKEKYCGVWVNVILKNKIKIIPDDQIQEFVTDNKYVDIVSINSFDNKDHMVRFLDDCEQVENMPIIVQKKVDKSVVMAMENYDSYGNCYFKK